MVCFRVHRFIDLYELLLSFESVSVCWLQGLVSGLSKELKTQETMKEKTTYLLDLVLLVVQVPLGMRRRMSETNETER